MGSSESKLKTNDEKTCVKISSAPSTPLKSNSNTENISYLDPRSPSDEIFRTPLEIPSHSNEHPTVSNLHCIDPRSPSDQFERTPIIVKEIHCQHPLKLHNKILDNARRNITYSPTLSSKSIKDCDSPKPSASPPKLISSIPTFKKCNEKRKSFVGLLETNIDFTETNLDDFIKTKSLNKNLTISIDDLPMCDIVEHKNCDPRSPSKDFLRTPIQIVKKVGEVDLNNTVNEWEIKQQTAEKDDCKAESLLKLVDENNVVESEYCATEFEEISGVNEDADRSDEQVLVTNIQNEEAVQIDNTNPDTEKNTEQKMAEIVEDLIGHITTLTTEEPTEIVPYIDNLEIKEPIIDLTADVQEFDKKLTKIIHENNENFPFKKIISKDYLNEENPRKRTPMKDRNQIAEPKRNKLKVSDKPRKLDYDISKIPVFRDKNGAKQKIQCENTPLTNMNIRKKKKSQQPRWDSEKTLVI